MPDSRNATAPAITAAGDGVSVGRRFTEAGVSPFDAVEWEIRDAVIGNPEDPAFEQRGVEFPKTWSQNATNIVSQKYFRGRMDSPERENSVKQMIGRVAGTIAEWGREGGYFASEDDAEAFNDELTHILLHQMAAFNSPVWFNVGFEEHPQCSACQPYHALVSTPEGMVPIGEIVQGEQIGREVYDANGVTQVVAVKANGRKRVLRAKLRNGSFVEATPDHVVKAVAERRTDAGLAADGPARARHAPAPPSAPGEGRRAGAGHGGSGCPDERSVPRDRRGGLRRARPSSRGRAGRLASGRWLRWPVRDRHEPFADH